MAQSLRAVNEEGTNFLLLPYFYFFTEVFRVCKLTERLNIAKIAEIKNLWNEQEDHTEKY